MACIMCGYMYSTAMRNVRTCVDMARVYLYIHTYIHTCMHACMHTYMRTYRHTYIHAYIQTYIHTYVRTYIHTCVYIYRVREGEKGRQNSTTKANHPKHMMTPDGTKDRNSNSWTHMSAIHTCIPLDHFQYILSKYALAWFLYSMFSHMCTYIYIYTYIIYIYVYMYMYLYLYMYMHINICISYPYTQPCW